jgi:hypothetical protein
MTAHQQDNETDPTELPLCVFCEVEHLCQRSRERKGDLFEGLLLGGSSADLS